MSVAIPLRWTYEQVALHLREIATVFLNAVPEEPRVAILADNCVEGACCDLACLFYDILDTPLNPQFDRTVLAGIFDRLEINIVVTDTENRRRRLEEVGRAVKKPFKVYLLDRHVPAGPDGEIFLNEVCDRLGESDMNAVLAKRARGALDRVATIMFTSGSTGEPRGVSFSLYNLVAKRFARAAALPAVGRDEEFLCYLPLYHTFGRFLEMLGIIYWGGTYVFAGNPSSERLFSLFPKVNPTGFISVPIRWAQLHERAAEGMDASQDASRQREVFRSVVGSRLRWGLSAAGYLSPRTFRFFQGNGVELCNGFGMTEATGGVTMTPPGEYVDNTTGAPLPGVSTRLGRGGELQISGHYVAWYLEEKGPGDTIPFPEHGGEEHWVSTGDVFRIRPDGYHEIVDRIKDIYKNSKGQTIAPRKLESKFVGVPGVKRVCLVGDGRPYNVLLIVPDENEPALKTGPFSKDRSGYFRQLVAAANQSMASYERAVSFTLLDRDFHQAKGESSPKGSLKRRIIEEHFAEEIEALYARDFIEIPCRGFRVRIPRWFFRDLGIVEGDIRADDKGLTNCVTGNVLSIREHSATLVQIGDLLYTLSRSTIDLGLFSRQPLLWIGNPELVAFCPCKEGWEVALEGVSAQVSLPADTSKTYSLGELPELRNVRDPILIVINKLISSSLHGDEESALRSIDRLGEELKEADDHIGDAIWRRLEALSHHRSEDVRCLAYQTLLLDEPALDLSRAFPTFVLSGAPFLNEKSIRSIAFANVEQRRLDALRKRLFTYRTQLQRPLSRNTRVQMERVLRLLSEFTELHPAFFYSARGELASWALHAENRALMNTARQLLDRLSQWYDSAVAAATPRSTRADWRARLSYDENLTSAEIERIEAVLIGTTFLKQSILLAFDERAFALDDVVDGGIQLSRMQARGNYRCFLVKVRTRAKKHYSLRLVLPARAGVDSVRRTLYWYTSIAGHPFGSPVLPRLGACRKDFAAYSARHLDQQTVWDHVKARNESSAANVVASEASALRTLFVHGLEAFFRGWRRSEHRIVPGSVTPDNVVVAEFDFPENARIVSIAGWTKYKNCLSLVRPALENFYKKTLARFPSLTGSLDTCWIFDACIEALGEESAGDFFARLLDDLEKEPLVCHDGRSLRAVLVDYRDRTRGGHYVPLSLANAVERYTEWDRTNPAAAACTREEIVIDLYDTYQLRRFSEIARYYLYRNTYFASAGAGVRFAFDRLLSAMSDRAGTPVVELPELSDLSCRIFRPP